MRTGEARMMHSKRASILVATLLATSGDMAFAQPDPAPEPVQPPESWRAFVGYHDRPTCQLYAPGVGDSSKGLVLVPNWKAKEGWKLWFLTHLKGIQSVRFESQGIPWDVNLEPESADYHGRHAFLEPAVADSMLRDLELGHALNMTVTIENETPLSFRIPMNGAQFAAPMYRACVKSMIDDPPPWYLFQPFAIFRAYASDDGRCEFWQLIEHGRFPVRVTLYAAADRGEVVIERDTETRDPHRSYQERKDPDRVDAKQLFGPSFDLLRTFRYDITLAQLDEIARELARGETRALWFTNKAGKQTELEFGGRWGEPTAAMFAACRTVRLQ
jgi:hypothetical protein